MSSQTMNGNGTTEGTTVMRRCMPLATGALSTDLRVNYQFGLVLGETEFRQEQLYFLERDHRHHRALHGYGTVYGLKVEVATEGNDALITVKPGMAVDQWGRPVVVRDDQCAKLLAWLAAQERATPGIIGQYRGLSGELRVYVVTRHDECEDALAPIAGEPCATAESLQAPSRIRDSHFIELRFAPPQMTAWDVARDLADLLAKVRFVTGLSSDLSDKGLLLEAMSQLNIETVMPGPPGPPLYRLPRETARQDLDDLFTFWVTEVRPRVEPHLSDVDDAEAGVLLARIDCIVNGPANTLTLVHVEPPDDNGRPFLLHTQLMQELLLLGNAEAGTRPQREFATLHVRDRDTVIAWIHYPVVLDDIAVNALALQAEGQATAIRSITRLPDLENLFLIELDDSGRFIEPGDRVAAHFRLAQITVSGGGRLLDDLEGSDFDYVGHDHDTLTVYTIVDEIPPTRPFVTIDTIFPTDGSPFLELWFHTNAGLHLAETVEAFRLQDREMLTFRAQAIDATGVPDPTPFSIHWRLGLQSTHTLNPGDRLEFRFDTDAIPAGQDTVRLTQRIRQEHRAYLGYDGDHSLEVFYQLETPARPVVQPPPGLTLAELFEQLFKMPTLPFATIRAQFNFSDNNEQPLEGEIWLHPTLNPDENKVEFQEPLLFKIAAERVDGTLGVIPADKISVGQLQRNVFAFTVDRDDYKEITDRSPYLRFIFQLGENKLLNTPSGTLPLGDYIQKNEPPIKFEGHNGGEVITVYVRVTQQRELG